MIKGECAIYFERHVHSDKELPIYFQHQTRTLHEPRYELHWHETLEWILVTSGQVEIRIDDTTEVYPSGALVSIPPHSPHCFRAIDGECSYYCMIPDNSILSAGGIQSVVLKPTYLVNDDRIRALFGDIICEYEEKKPFYKNAIRGALIQMISLLLRDRVRDCDDASPNMGDNAMRITKNAIEYMEEHYAENFSGEALAAHLGFSRSYLCHVISKVTGQSLTENLLYIRCRKAREFLRQGYAVGEVVFMAGFQNASYFCRTYKRMMGVAPSVHRKK